MRAVKVIGWSIAVLLVLITVLVVVLLSLDLSTYRDPLQSGISKAVGRQVNLRGEMSLELSLHPTIAIEDLRVANPPWASRPDFARAGRVEVQLALWPLLHGNLDILNVGVDGLDVLFEARADGANNWTFGQDTGTSPALPAIQSLSCEQCAVAYRVDADREERLVIAAAAGALALDEPVQFLLSGSYRDIPFTVSLLGGTLTDLVVSSQPWPLEVRLRTAGATLEVKGDVDQADANLHFAVSGEQFGELVRLTGGPLPALGPYGLSGRLVKKDENYNVTNLAGHLGDKESANLFAIDTGSVALAADEPIHLSMEGKVGELPFGVTATGGTPGSLIAPVKPWAIELSATSAGARLEIKGTIAEPLKARGPDLRVSIRGKQLAELASLVRIPLPRLGPYRFSGRVRERDSGYAITGVAGYLGRADRPAHVVIRTGRILLPDSKALRLNLEGTYEKTPLRISFIGGPLMELTAPTKPWPVKLDASGAGATLAMRGNVARPSAGAGFDLRVDLKGRRLSRLARLLTLTLPEVDSYTASGRIRDRNGSYVVTKLKAQADDTDVSGSLILQTRGTRPKLSAKLASRMFKVDKLIVAGTTATGKPEKFSLDDRLPIDWLRTMDADLEVEIGRIVGAPTAIRNLAMSAKLERGKAALTLMHVSLLGTAAAGAVTLDASGDTPSVVLDLSTKSVDLDKAVSAFARSERLRGTTGNMELHLASSGHTLRTLIEQARLTLDAQAMKLSYRSQPDGTVIPVKISTARATATAGQAVRVVVDGAVHGVPIKLDLTTGKLVKFAVSSKAWPIRVELNAADAVFKANGVVAQPLEGQGFDVGFDLQGKELSALNQLLGMELPTMGSYELSGRFANSAGTHHLHQLQVGLGKHRAAGQVKLTTTKLRPHIAVKLETGTLDIDHLVDLLRERKQQAVAEPADRRVIPALAISGESLPQVDIELDVDVTDVLAQAIDIGDVRIKANLNNGRIVVSSFKAKLFGGYISGNLEIDPTREKPEASIKLTVRHLDYGAWLQGWQISDAVTGKVDLNIDLSGHGKTLRALLGDADGAVVLVSGPTHIAGSGLGIWGAGLTSGLMSITTTGLGIKKSTEFNCMVWPFNVTHGLARSDAIVMDTRKITIEGSGTVNLVTEEMDIVLKPARKKASIFSFKNPVRISGPLTNPQRTTLGKGETAAKAGLVFLTGGVFLIFTASTGTGEINPCVAALSAADTGDVSPEKQKNKQKKQPELGLVGELLGAIRKPVDEGLDASEAESNHGQ